MKRASKQGSTTKEIAQAEKQYVRDHWGQDAGRTTRALPAADPRIVGVELGDLVAVVYRTRKGEDVALTDYEHRFARPFPVLSYNPTGLVISGGKYRVTERGIID